MKGRLRQVEEIQRLDEVRIYTLERKVQALEQRLNKLLRDIWSAEEIHSPQMERPAQGEKASRGAACVSEPRG